MLVSKDILNPITVWPRLIQNEGLVWEYRRKKDRMVIGITTKIIQEEVNNVFFNNIINKDNLQVMWEKLKSICFQTGIGVVYLIFQELLTYLKVNKPKWFEKSVTSHFSEIRVLVKPLKGAVTSNRDI